MKMVKMIGGWSCMDCMYSSKYTTDVRRHIESKHMSDFLFCALCDITFDTFNHFKQHYILCHIE